MQVRRVRRLDLEGRQLLYQVLRDVLLAVQEHGLALLGRVLPLELLRGMLDQEHLPQTRERWAVLQQGLLTVPALVSGRLPAAVLRHVGIQQPLRALRMVADPRMVAVACAMAIVACIAAGASWQTLLLLGGLAGYSLSGSV